MAKSVSKANEQVQAEAEVDRFRKELGPFVVAAETTRMAMVFTDAQDEHNPIIFANDSYLLLTGYTREEVLGQRFNFLMAHVTDEKALAIVEAEFDGDSKCSEICYRRKDGSHFWAAIFVTPVRDSDGRVVQHFASFVDLTAHKDDEVRRNRLIDELNHRVKNTLSTVQAIVTQALRNFTDPKTARNAIESRLLALSRSHDLLTRENWESVDLRDVLKDALAPFGVRDGLESRILMAGEDIRLPPKYALALGIVFNELATNAVKYGALSNAAGSIRIQWDHECELEEPQIVLRWQEADGPTATPPARKGFGTRVIQNGLSHELGGKVNMDYLPDGLVCTMTIPTMNEGVRNGQSTIRS